MEPFLENARNILEAAEGAARAGFAPSDLTILVGPEGIRMFAESDWPLERLLAHHGGDMAYRVREHKGTVCVEGRAGGRCCRLEAHSGAAAARQILGGGPPLTRCPLPAGTSLIPRAAWD